MSLEMPAQNAFKSIASFESSVVANDDERQRSATAKRRLGHVVGYVIALEFLAVAGAAYIGGLVYHVFLSADIPTRAYGLWALFIGLLVSLVSAAFQHFGSIQIRPLHVLLWSGIGAVGLSFSLLLSTMFLLKIGEDYSRGAFLFQLIGVCFAVICVRAFAFSWVRSAIASGQIKARKVVLIGDAARCAQFSNRLKTSAIQSIASFRSPCDHYEFNQRRIRGFEGSAAD